MASIKDRTARPSQPVTDNLRRDFAGVFLALFRVVFLAMSSRRTSSERGQAKDYSAADRSAPGAFIPSISAASIRREMTFSRFLAKRFFKRATRAF